MVTACPPSSPPPKRYEENGNGNHETSNPDDDTTSMTAAADLIRTLDSAYLEMSSLSASAARDAEDARRNAREASEVARRYTARFYAGGLEHSHNKVRDYHHTNDSVGSRHLSNENGDKETSVEEANGPFGVNSAEQPDTITQQSLPPGGRKRKMYTDRVQSSSERLARSHAEDVLSLSLELERTKQALENERIAHDETRSSLTEARAKHTQFETQIQKLLNDAETQREDYSRQMDALQQELQRAQVRVEAAEEDAQLALDLAKGNAESREQLEMWLQRALQEVEVLRGQLERVGAYGGAILPMSPEYVDMEPTRRKPVVRFAEPPTVMETAADDNEESGSAAFSPRRQASRSMVAAGRHLLHRATTGNDEKVHAVSLTPEKSAERRERLRQRLRDLDRDVGISAPASTSSGMSKKAMGQCSNVARLLRESGQRLGLDTIKQRMDDAHVEAMARQFCQTVESKLNKQKEDIQELQSLCDYLENKLVVSGETVASSRSLNASLKQSPS